jgi:hypothetical protein
MRRGLLSHLITVIQNVPDHQWDMSMWWKDCGSVGCAIGHAAHDQVFINEGLRLEVNIWSVSRKPVVGHYDHMEAVARLFEISIVQADDLFDNSSYFERESDDENIEMPVTKEMVISRIQALLS